MKKSDALESYKKVGKQELVNTRDPAILIKMLFDKACLLLRTSINSLSENQTDQFHKSSLHALQIIISLRFVLDTSANDQLSKSLFDTYTSIAASLFKAREDEDVIALSKIYEALDELRGAWAILLSK